MFRPTFIQPLSRRKIEFGLEFSLEITDTHVGYRCERFYIANTLIISQNKILEVIIVADDRAQQRIKVLGAVIAT